MRILIVEDELLVATDIRMQLADFGFEECHIATNYTEAISILESAPIHLALLDIQLGGYKTGIDVAQYIRDNIAIPFIFLTTHEDLSTVNAALSTAPNAYLQKPFKASALYATIHLALQAFKKNQDAEAQEDDSLIIRDAFFVKDKGSYVRILLGDVHYIRSDGNYMEVFTEQRKYMVRIPQKVLLAQLPASFVKVHKSYIVNCDHVDMIDADAVIVKKVPVPLIAGYRAELLSRFKTFS